MPCRLYCALTPFGVTNTQFSFFSFAHGIPFCIFNVIILICFRGRLLCELLCTFFCWTLISDFHCFYVMICAIFFRAYLFIEIPELAAFTTVILLNRHSIKCGILFMENDIRFDYDSHVSNIPLPFALMNDFHFSEKLKLFINIRESCIHKNQSHKNLCSSKNMHTHIHRETDIICVFTFVSKSKTNKFHSIKFEAHIFAWKMVK